jgi:hypothetical protein
MSIFHSWRSYWEFEKSVKFHNRYVRDPSAAKFLDTVLVTSKNRRKIIPKGGYLWRAQLGQDTDDDGQVWGLSPKRMKPIPGLASEGRANPNGIQYLYLATDKETAMAEVRPWLGSSISVGQFRINRRLSTVDCSADGNSPIFFLGEREPEPRRRERAVWSHINDAFSRPVNLSDEVGAYVPTQIIAELFKNEGIDGLLYRSSLGKGTNVVLFNPEDADIVNCCPYNVKEIHFDFEQTGNPYVVKSKKKTKQPESRSKV